MAKHSTSAIYHVAQLTQLNNKLDENIAKIERSASQYVVLKDTELLNSFNRHQNKLQAIIKETLAQQQDVQLKEQLTSLKVENEKLRILMNSTKVDGLSLMQLQGEFKLLHTITEQLAKRSNFVVNQQVFTIHNTTEDISNNMLKRLFIIPLTLLIAGIFIVLITKPLKRLTNKIKILEQGNFEQEIKLQGSAEVIAIADALENMRQRLHTLELQKSSFIRHISHELKTPLAAIREGTELIYDNSVGSLNDDQQEICNIIRTSVGRLQRLIEDLLDFNIVLDSTSLNHLEKISLSDLINEACTVRLLDIKSKDLTLKCDSSPCIIYSNSKQLSVILDNILSNAIKYSPINGTIAISYNSNKTDLTINIIDQGPGIEPSLTEKVFDAFYQSTPPENNPIKGSGLGLTIVKELLLRLNGHIKITSAKKLNAVNQSGTCVTITLPLNTPTMSTQVINP
ncbi:HAMP domain-containing sensor histidine kinase [Colwellia sp. E2M01]|uniref:HAMP domain-containing sensor histidine kinase n=1 Tax=Colwellia sp. E2M01 TaxID=2841561 RepID=UPI002090CCD9|nr:HAMP domain-containing sensor histidine kinase [Colwellia sp. E2M01]